MCRSRSFFTEAARSNAAGVKFARSTSGFEQRGRYRRYVWLAAPMKSTLGFADRRATRSQRYGALGVAVLIAGVSGAALSRLGAGPGPEIKPFITITATIWSLADLLTAFLLLAQFYVSGRLLFGILAVAYAVSGLCTWPFIAAFPGLIGSAAQTVGHEQIASAMWLVWHSTFPILVVVAALNDSPRARVISRRRVTWATAAGALAPLAFASVVTVLAFTFHDALPHFIIHGQFQPFYKSAVLPVLVALNALSCLVLLGRQRPLTPLTLWLALATFSAAIDCVLLTLSSGRYSYAWDAGKLITVFTASVVLVTILCDIIGPITLGATERRYRALAEAMPQMVWTAGPDGSVQYWNHNWREYTGTTFIGTTDRVWAHVLHEHDLPRFLAAWAASRHTGKMHEIEYRIVRAKDRAARWHIGRVIPIRDESGAVEQWVGSCTDIHDYKLASETREVLDTIGHIVAIHAEDGAMVYASPRYEHYTGASAHAVLGQRWRTFVHPDDLEHVDAHLRHAREFGLDALQYEMRIRAKAGEYRWFLAQTAALPGAAGSPRSWLETLTDIEELKLTQTALAHDIEVSKNAELAIATLRDAALAATEAKSSFLATMSHEIRTPMNGIVGMAELIWHTGLDAEQRDFVRVIRDSSQSLLRVLNDILDYSKVEAGKLDLELVAFDLRSQIEAVENLLRPQFEAKTISLASTFTGDIPAQVVGDPGRLRQVLLNLVGNALKFTPPQGSVRIRVERVSGDDGTVPIMVTVEDSGIGIETDVVDRLFQPFSQADGSTTRRFGGTGLGLSISAQLVALMNGTIGVESQPGRGSAFWFLVLLKPFRAGLGAAAAPEAFARDFSLRPPRPRPEKILVVEDNSVNALVARKQLERLGFTICEVLNGRLAVEAVQRERFDLIFMDLHMPEMDGYEATATIRRQEAGGPARVPIVAMTADARDEDHERCLAAGMDDYISKPTSLENLAAVIALWIGAPAETRAPSYAQPTPSKD
jgi:PAS domain S-box-containing protein